MNTRSMAAAALFLAAVLVGCQSTSTEMTSWVGKSDTALMAHLGAPDREATTGDGSRVLSYNTRNAFKYVVCSRNFVVNPSHIVVSTSNDCPM